LERLLAVLFWSVIPAAFVGPGTVTTCITAGARHGTALLWALTFSTVACIALQQASARVAATTGLDMGEALRRKHARAGGIVAVGVLVAVVAGCAAYEAGNILGAAAGAALRLPLPAPALSASIAAAAALLLWTARTATVARILGGMVAVMAVAFAATAAEVAPPLREVARGLVRPSLPEGSALLVLGLVGTTVVPYNLFLGAGLARGRSLREARFGIAVAVVLGGTLSASIVVAGTAVGDAVSFEAIAAALEERFGAAGPWCFSLGLFAAGFTSAITAPLAAAIAARGVFAGRGRDWSDRSPAFRAVWLGVLLFGAAFGIAGVKPIPAILLAQALNGVMLPFVAVSLVLLVNDRRLLGTQAVAGPVANAILVPATAATVVLGVQGVLRAATSTGLPDPGETVLHGIAAIVTVALVWPVGRSIARGRRN
jgi:Mn2+/Fe2+ NRAMP family transporter